MKGWKRKGVTTPHLLALRPWRSCGAAPTTGSAGMFSQAAIRKKCMSDATVNAALRRMGYDTKTEMTGHGFGRWPGRSCMKPGID